MAEAEPVGPLVVGYDGREESERAFDEAVREAERRGTTLAVVVVAPIPVGPADPFDPAYMGVGVIQPIPDAGPVEIQPILEEARRRLESSPVEGTVEWSLGDPAIEILRVAQERRAAAIVVGTHHHSALGRLFGTDTAANITRSADCDVLVAR